MTDKEPSNRATMGVSEVLDVELETHELAGAFVLRAKTAGTTFTLPLTEKQAAWLYVKIEDWLFRPPPGPRADREGGVVADGRL